MQLSRKLLSGALEKLSRKLLSGAVVSEVLAGGAGAARGLLRLCSCLDRKLDGGMLSVQLSLLRCLLKRCS